MGWLMGGWVVVDEPAVGSRVRRGAPGKWGTSSRVGAGGGGGWRVTGFLTRCRSGGGIRAIWVGGWGGAAAQVTSVSRGGGGVPPRGEVWCVR